MSLTGSILNGIGSISRIIKSGPPSRRDRIIDVMPSWFHSSAISLTNTMARSEYINHFKGWNYVAIKAICEEIAGFAPSVCTKEDGREVHDKYRKSLSAAKGHQDRERIRSSFAKSYVSKSMRRKALANLQDSDELKPVGKDHSLVRLLANPNGPDVSWSFWYKVTMFLELTGAAYIWCPPNKTGRPSQLWVIPSHWVWEQPGEDSLVGSYEIRPVMGAATNDLAQFGAGWFPGGGGVERIRAEQIIKIAYPSPYSIVDGYAPVAAISDWIDVSNNIDRSRVQVFANAAFPGVALELDKEMAAPTLEEMDRVRIDFSQKYQGVRNTGVPAILAPGMKIVPLTRSSVEMDYANSADQMRGNLLSSHRVPQSIVGLVEQSTYANAEASRFNFFGSCIRPKLMFLGQVLTEKLANRWDENLVVYWPDPTPNDPEMRMKKYETMYRNQAVTPNEWREAEGMSPWEHGGDDPVGSQMATQPLGWATGEDPMANMQQSMMGGMPGQPGGDQTDLGGMVGQMLGQGGGDGATEEPQGELDAFGQPVAKSRINGHTRKAVRNGVH